MTGLYSTTKKLANAVADGDRRALSQAITLVESHNPKHRENAQKLMEIIQVSLKNAKPAFRIGLSGPPGVGKSTFTEAIGMKLLQQNHKLAVLAIDPSSSHDGGSILADKTRMPRLATMENAYIRPSPSRAELGGVTRQTYNTILLCEAAGFDRIIIETVGVGQSEVAVAEMCDFFVLLLLPESGDEFQALKRGIMQLVDCILVNKTDGDLRMKALRTAAEYSSALRLMVPRIEGWSVPVANISSLEGDGLDDVLVIFDRALRYLEDNDLLLSYRMRQNLDRMWADVGALVLEHVRGSSRLREIVADAERRMQEGDLLPTHAASEIFRKLNLE